MSPSSAAPAAAPPTAAHFHVAHVHPFSARARPATRPRGGGRPRASASAAEGPSCLFVGPIDSASKEMLEALYQQAKYSYYNGKPLIVDDMFDKVELKLRLYGSKSVVKYPRCSLRRHSTYADAEEDPSQVFALASVWMLLFVFGSSAILVPVIYAVVRAVNDAIESRYFYHDERSPFDILMIVNVALFIGLGFLVGYPVASASAMMQPWEPKQKFCLHLVHEPLSKTYLCEFSLSSTARPMEESLDCIKGFMPKLRRGGLCIRQGRKIQSVSSQYKLPRM